MALTAIDRVFPDSPIDQLPARFELTSSPGRDIVRVVLMAPLAAAVTLPFCWVAAQAAGAPEALSAIGEDPATAVELLVGLTLAILLTAIPLKGLIERLGRRLEVSIEASEVKVVDRSVLGTRRWSAPLGEFAGLSHRLRSSLSSTQHEIVLMHPASSRSLVLRTAPKVTESEMERTAKLLGLPIVGSALA